MFKRLPNDDDIHLSFKKYKVQIDKEKSVTNNCHVDTTAAGISLFPLQFFTHISAYVLQKDAHPHPALQSASPTKHYKWPSLLALIAPNHNFCFIKIFLF